MKKSRATKYSTVSLGQGFPSAFQTITNIRVFSFAQSRTKGFNKERNSKRKRTPSTATTCQLICQNQTGVGPEEEDSLEVDADEILEAYNHDDPKMLARALHLTMIGKRWWRWQCLLCFNRSPYGYYLPQPLLQHICSYLPEHSAPELSLRLILGKRPVNGDALTFGYEETYTLQGKVLVTMRNTLAGNEYCPAIPEYKWVARCAVFGQQSLIELAWGSPGRRHPRILHWLEKKVLSTKQLMPWDEVKFALQQLEEANLPPGEKYYDSYEETFEALSKLGLAPDHMWCQEFHEGVVDEYNPFNQKRYPQRL